MIKCRLCLKNSKKLRSMFDKENNISYVDMASSISNLKIKRDDKVTDLCLLCCRKLKELFDFKNMIEMTNLIYIEDGNLRRINFNNLDEIKIKIEIDVKKEDSKKYSGILEKISNSNKEFLVNNTTIKKKTPGENAVDNGDNAGSIKNEPNYDDEMDNWEDYYYSTSDDDYVPKKSNNKKECVVRSRKASRTTNEKENKVERRQNKSNMIAQKVLIKPVFLEGIRIVRTKEIRKKPFNQNPKQSSIKKQMCNFCGKMTSSMKTHILVHTGKKTHKCDSCNKAYYTAAQLKYHKLKHEKGLMHKCDQCVASFNDLSSLKGHMKVHSEEKKFVCRICNKSFKRRSALNRHEIQHNSANKNVKCDHCNMTFFTKYALKSHLRVHTGERPCRCEICSQGYSFKRDFNRHCFKKHGVFIDRRSVYVMNEEVLVKERELMRALMLRLRGVVQGEDPFKEFEGPQGYIALEQAIRLLETKQVPVDFHF